MEIVVFKRQSQALWLLVTALILLLNFLAGPKMQLTLLLVFPVVALAWQYGFRSAFIVGVCGCIFRYSFNYFWGEPFVQTHALLNLLFRSMSFVLLAYMISRASALVRQLCIQLQALDASHPSVALAKEILQNSQSPWPLRMPVSDDTEPHAPSLTPQEVEQLMLPLSFVQKVALKIQAWCWKHPELVWLLPYNKVAAGWGPGAFRLRELCQKNYDLLVDGYPRSANSYFAMAVRVASPGLSVRCHCHKPTHVIQAVRDKKPACVLIREPVDAISSSVIHFRWTMAQAVEIYINYYELLKPYKNHFVVATFEQATKNVPEVFAVVNAKFGIAVPIPVDDHVFRDTVKSKVRELSWGHDPFWVSLPSHERTPLLQLVKSRLLGNERLSERLAYAQLLYDTFTQSAEDFKTSAP